MADREIRRSVFAGLRRCSGGSRVSAKLFLLLQSRTDASVLGISNAGGGLLPEADSASPRRENTNGNDRVSLRSSIVGHYRAHSSCRKLSQARKAQKLKILACGNCRSCGNPQKARIPTGAWKSLRLSHSFHKALRGSFRLTLIQKGRATIHLKEAYFLS